MWNSNHSADRQEQRGQPGLKEQVGLARVNVPAGYWSEKVSETRNQRYIAEGAPFFCCCRIHSEVAAPAPPVDKQTKFVNC